VYIIRRLSSPENRAAEHRLQREKLNNASFGIRRAAAYGVN
jgi:hypothetical protein